MANSQVGGKKQRSKKKSTKRRKSKRGKMQMGGAELEECQKQALMSFQQSLKDCGPALAPIKEDLKEKIEKIKKDANDELKKLEEKAEEIKKNAAEEIKNLVETIKRKAEAAKNTP